MRQIEALSLESVRACIELLERATAIEPIHKGFSFDGKYFVYERPDRPTYVLRTAPANKLDIKRREYEIVRLVHDKQVRTSEPIAFGVVEPLELCYMLLRYVEGEDASESLPLLTEDEQYAVGRDAGKELRLMHEIEAPAHPEPWHVRRTAKHNRQLGKYRGCGVKLPEETAIVQFIDDHLHLMEGRPDRFQHDDFHPGNLLVRGRKYAAAIDYNRYDWGDPYHDFMKIAYFSREVSIPFSVGQIDGYFDGHVPHLFWQLYALYTAMTILPTITWTLQVVPEQIGQMMERIRVVLDDHRGFRDVVPGWYSTYSR